MKVKEFRKQHGWNREQMASRLNVTMATIYRWERGISKPSRLAQEKLERLLSGNKVSP